MVRWEVVSQPGKPINSIILDGGGQTSVFNYVPNGSYVSTSPLSLLGSPPINTTTLCYNETSSLPQETLPSCNSLTQVQCRAGFQRNRRRYDDR